MAASAYKLKVAKRARLRQLVASQEFGMLFDPKKLRELLDLAVGPLLAVGTLGAAVTAGVNWLTPILAHHMDQTFAAPLGIIAPLVAACTCLWAAYRALAKKSRLLRLERFDLRVRKHEDLLGRDEDVANLKALIDDSSLLLVDGESGSGKSSLVAFGLIPKLNHQSSVPILVSDYAGDWDTGLARRVFDAAWSALSAEDRTKIGFTERPAIGTVNADTVRAALDGIGTRLGRMPIVILDQFDDYQLAARDQFLGRRRDWIKPTDLIRRNRTWAVIRDLLREGRARLLVVTRSDASAGLHSIRLADQPGSFTVARLKLEWLVQWLEQVTVNDGKGDVIANPDAGWTDVKKQLERDLTAHGASVNVVLPQQVRIVFLGLRKLPSLTLTDYERAASGADAITSAASESGLNDGDVRALLSAFVDRAEAGRLKTKVLSFAELQSVVRNAQKLQKALDRLERDEVVREKTSVGGGSRWQLGHDYIARAIVAENRAANIFSFQLQDGNDAWRMAGRALSQSPNTVLASKTRLGTDAIAPRIRLPTVSCLCRHQHASRLALRPPACRCRLALARGNTAYSSGADRGRT
jgi:Novel STAND NTPase 1